MAARRPPRCCPRTADGSPSSSPPSGRRTSCRSARCGSHGPMGASLRGNSQGAPCRSRRRDGHRIQSGSFSCRIGRSVALPNCSESALPVVTSKPSQPGGAESAITTPWPSPIRLPSSHPTNRPMRTIDGPSNATTRRSGVRRVRFSRLRLLDLRTREIRTAEALGDRHVVEVVQRPDGGPLAVLTWATPDLDPGLLEPALHLLGLDSGATQDLGAAEVNASSLVWWHAEAGW